MTAEQLAVAAEARGLHLAEREAGDLLARAAAMGLARVAADLDGAERYVATSLGQRAGIALLAVDPELGVGLEELERLRSELLATIGHELRTPLTAIRTSAGLLLDPGLEPSDAQRQQLLTTIGRSADRMQRLLAELLDLARLRSGRVDMEMVRFDARGAAHELATEVAPLAAARGQRLVVEVPDRPVMITGDRRRIEQAVLNLLSNAQKFSGPGTDVTLRIADDEDGLVRWSVIDHGPGIGPDDRERLFERFFVGTADRRGVTGGTGIGLPTALAIAQAHGGTIEVDSELGAGAAFHLILPRGDAR